MNDLELSSTYSKIALFQRIPQYFFTRRITLVQGEIYQCYSVLNSLFYHCNAAEEHVDLKNRWGGDIWRSSAVLSNSAENHPQKLTPMGKSQRALSSPKENRKEFLHARVILHIRRNVERCSQYLPTCSMPIFKRLVGSEKLANLVSFKGFKHTHDMTLFRSAIFVVGSAFENMISFRVCLTRRRLCWSVHKNTLFFCNQKVDLL